MWVGRANPIIQGSFLGCSKNVFLCHSKDIKKSHKNIISSKIENGNLEVKYCGEGLFLNRIDNRSLRNYFLKFSLLSWLGLIVIDCTFHLFLMVFFVVGLADVSFVSYVVAKWKTFIILFRQFYEEIK